MINLKKKVLNKDSYIIAKNITIVIISFAILFSLTFFVIFIDYKDKLIKQTKIKYDLQTKSHSLVIKPYVLDHNIKLLNKQIDKIILTNDFKSISLKFDELIFTKEALINNTPNFSDISSSISDVVIDIRYGKIEKLSDNYYYFKPSIAFKKEDYISIRYQAYKDNEVKNLFASFEFNTLQKNEPNIENRINFPFWLDLIFDEKFENIQKQLYYKDKKIATIDYIIDMYNIKYEIYSFTKSLFFYAFFMFFPVLIFFRFYNYYVFKKYVTKPIHKLNILLDDILENKFHKIRTKEFDGTQELKEMIEKVAELSSKLASNVNELNISKETIQRKKSTDTLTGLENQKIFEQDIKSMFVSSISGYVIILRLPSLKEFSQLNGSNTTDTFIENFVNIVKNVIYRFSKIDITMYRFYGSEFAIIAKRFDSIKANQLCEAIIHTTIKELSQKYKLPENFLTIGGTPFDLYGTLNSILKSANEAYDISKEKTNSYHLITEEQIEHNYATLEKVVSTIIHDANFDVDYASNSYSFDDKKLVMQEVSPLVYDNNQQKLPIGSFVSIAEKINEIITFDKLVIQKVIEYLKYSKATHEIAINLAVDTISNKDFNKWLEDILTANANLKKKIVFSITSYTASLHKHKFKKFVKHINQLEAKVLLKRYNTNDYPLEELEDIKVDYLRIDKEYTNNLANDKIKRHKVKNILIFAQLNNMEILTENVKSDNDYAFLERLGVYATSR